MHPDARPRIISMMMSSSLWRIFPLPDLLKSGMEEENSFSLYKILPREPNLFTTFVIWLCASASIERTWSSGLIWFITVWFSPIKLRKNLPFDLFVKILILLKIKRIWCSQGHVPQPSNCLMNYNCRSKNHPHNPRNTRYKITIFLSKQHFLKWKSRVHLPYFSWQILSYSLFISIFVF